MKRNLKWKERLGALLLAVLFVMQAILSFLPMDMVQAAAKGIEIWQTSSPRLAAPEVPAVSDSAPAGNTV